ncbi:HU family DNA-binding protein [Nonomuraea rubra]|uniref:Nucleoid DNA-binding protein n=1 Tax=Nonomuraea rubra TaxID=46180 RepID=A0A7X0P8E4_9ACTN|nr:HU family DNA-binding protein [Nonomuraea rubra]MBB6557225.1 nucleoid DNA-binding protein [Nonomuraea rubra]
MNKADVIEEFRQRTDAPSRAAAARSVEAFIDIIVGAVAAGGEVRIGRLGVFDRNYHKATARRNPNTNEVIDVPGKWVMRFRPAKAVKAAVNK